jgi:hypothetical protein
VSEINRSPSVLGPIRASQWYHATISNGGEMVEMVALRASTIGNGEKMVRKWRKNGGKMVKTFFLNCYKMLKQCSNQIGTVEACARQCDGQLSE